jgi:glycosyltransferase involved in cell wall biosynthesis
MTAPAPAPVVHVVAAGEVGGAERMLVTLARAAAAADNRGAAARRHLVALWTDDDAVRALFSGAGMAVVSPPRRGRMLTPWQRTTGGRDVAWLASYVRGVGAAAVHLHSFASHVLGTRAARLAGVPVVRTEHSTRVYENWLCRPFSRWSLHRSAAVVAVSDHLRRLIAAHEPTLGDRLRAIRNGVPLGQPAPPPSDSGPLRVGILARLEPRKAIDRALRALAAVPGPRLDIVGDGPLRDELEGLSAALGVADRVRFWGYRHDPDTVIAACDAVLCSSRTEGLPVALLEAMALGRPVIATPVGGVPEIVTAGDSGWLADAATDAGLTAALRDACAAGRAEMARRGLRARAAVERELTDLHMARGYERIYLALEAAPRAAVTAASARAAPGAARAS